MPPTNLPHPGYLLIPDPTQYGEGKDYKSPKKELKQFRPGMFWCWDWGTVLKEDDKPRKLLFSWRNAVFAEGTATVTRKLNREDRKDYRFAFVLKTYEPLDESIPFGELALGSRENIHRSLVRLDDKVLAAYQAARSRRMTGKADDEFAEEPTYPEGAETLRLHKRRERNAKLVRDKKAHVFADTGHLRCEVCSFDFAETYGERGHGFAECHHIAALAKTGGPVETRLVDLAIVCSNCHRMFHRRLPMPSVEKLKAMRAKARISD